LWVILIATAIIVVAIRTAKAHPAPAGGQR
jgi:hypothetical protein